MRGAKNCQQIKWHSWPKWDWICPSLCRLLHLQELLRDPPCFLIPSDYFISVFPCLLAHLLAMCSISSFFYTSFFPFFIYTYVDVWCRSPTLKGDFVSHLLMIFQRENQFLVPRKRPSVLWTNIKSKSSAACIRQITLTERTENKLVTTLFYTIIPVLKWRNSN